MVRPPVVLVGSGNVYPFLREKTPVLSKMNPVWLDIGSSGAMQQAFAGFDYGREVRSRKRVAFLAMSSNGTKYLEDLYDAADNSLRENNYWLSLTVAHPPLAILYREDLDRELKMYRSSKVPVQLAPSGSVDYNYVQFDDLKDFIENRSTHLDRYYFPEGHTGTRARFEEERGTVKWPEITTAPSQHSVEQVPDYIEELTGQFSFIELVSYPQLARVTQRPADWNVLSGLGIHAAVVCVSTSDQCDRLLLADYRIVIKVVPNGEGSNEFSITNRQECQIAEALDKQINDCQVFGSAKKNIITVAADSSVPEKFPEYLSRVR